MAEQHNRLEPFLILARGMKGAGAAKVVLDATAAVCSLPKLRAVLTPAWSVHVRRAPRPPQHQGGTLITAATFSDAQLANDATHEKTYRLLQLFAYGTLKDYAAGKAARKRLTEADSSA